jgi:ketosteroid isomerase-like protein
MKSLLVLLLLFSPGTTLYGQNPYAPARPTGSADQIKQDLVKIEREIGRANFECDYAYFGRVEADEFLFTDAAGSITTRKEDLAGEKDCRKSDGTYDLDDTRVELYGTAAVVTSRATVSGKSKEGKPFAHRNRFTDVFVWRDGRWQLVAGHSSRIPD